MTTCSLGSAGAGSQGDVLAYSLADHRCPDVAVCALCSAVGEFLARILFSGL